MTVGTGNFAELIWPGLAAITGHMAKQYPTLWDKVFETKRATKRFEKIQEVTGLGLASVKSEGAAVPADDPLQGFQKEFVMVTYGLMTSITREMVEDEMYSYINSVPRFLVKSIKQAEETTAFDVINRNQNSSYPTWDGVSLGSTAHLNPDGSTYSNQISTAADLSQTSIESLLQQILQATDNRGLQMRIMPKCLVVHPSNNFRARKILESSYVTGSADNDVNPIPGLFQDLVVSPYLDDTDAFHVITDVPNGMIFFRRRRNEVSRDNEFNTENLQIKITGRWDVGVGDPRSYYFSPGV